MRKSIVVFSLILSFGLIASAQKSELGLVVGGKFTPTGTSPVEPIKVDTASAFEVNYATQLFSASAVSLELNIPLIAAPNSTTNTFTAAKSYGSIFLTPGIRVRVGNKRIIPWVEAGIGLAHFSPSSTNQLGGPSGATSSTKAAFSGGGGLDLRPSKSPLAFRLEVRDLYAGVPNLQVQADNLHNNVLVGGGVVLRF